MPSSNRVEFTGGLGVRLAARLERPAGRPRAYALFAHCFSCSKDVFAAARITGRLAEVGIATLRFDFTGLGHSDGDFANTNFSSNVDDLVAAAQFLEADYEAPHILIGHSLGGAAVLAAAGRLPSVRAVATLAAPSDVEHVKHHFQDNLEEIEKSGEAHVKLAGRPFTIKKQFIDDISSQNIENAVGSLKRALLVCHSPIDATVSIDHATRIFKAAKHPKSFLSLDNADHLLTNRDHAIYAADVIAAWASRYAMTDAEQAARPKPSPGAAVVAETGAGKFQNHVVVGDHHFLSDEPVSVGGDDVGPSPYDLLNAALGACTSMTLRMYADRKGLPLERVRVDVSHERGHAEDCETCEENEKARVDIFTRKLTLDGPLDAEARKRMVEIADKCPVHRTLHGPVVVRTEEND
ncbi:MAG: alpha/beta fold hydrolase [Maricaulaceae bacterium]